MLNFANKITLFNKKEIVALFKAAKLLVQDKNFDLKRAPSSQDFGKILIIIPKKVGTAPQRNRLRRRVKAIFYEAQLFKLPYDFVIFFKPNSANLSFQDLKDIFNIDLLTSTLPDTKITD